MTPQPVNAPPLQVEQWFNTPKALSLEGLRGKVVLIEAFQMLCPGCVSHSLPQATRVQTLFANEPVAVIGLHSVFEHHAAMTPTALAAFLHEYRISFPVAVDAPSPSGPLPLTMGAYAMRGTPTLILIDRQGLLRHQHFGRIEDMELGARIMQLLCEPAISQQANPDPKISAAAATPSGACEIRR